MFAGLYIERKSLMHSLDPRSKLLWVLLVLVASIATQFNGLKSLPVFLSTILALSLSGLGSGLAVLLIFNSMVFLLVTTLIWAGIYSSQGNILLELGWLRLTDVGLLVALGKFFLIINPILAFVVFFASTKPYLLMWTLEKFKVPHKLALTFVIALSLMPTMVRAAGDVIDAQRARGLALDRGGILDRVRKHIPIIVPLFSKMLSDIWDLSLVLATRGAGYGRKTYIFEPSWKPPDTVFSALSLVFYGVVAAWGLGLIG
ncbi:energy-coupling factor transporter transmembrane protein EcfT [Infirmifilum lucidum]|uniref:Energy-coupling factor transporter transmembrane protein EcfT n=1 Tax=Infirmifilum lucidum TaxID=2776706 RepID=A0A7L9FHY6_9CREN|nr:energy-coupling factor transporter transmembrane component T [Infirmifilum lucidum]QOJ79410.1 energy-coupling factor transporter transmembrane protein EcfT [Infirmifilum lucidum]